ncbi:transaldolase family protein [Carboxylicivirga taeanensis]|uniref:transaldolase family protein n=1 Tax=Carboxylicivirga taeanensis TaxID=1416875 RepID=UPI003F6DE90A
MKQLIPNQLLYDLAANFDRHPHATVSSSYWAHFLSSGSHIWMDTGDIESVRELWTNEFSALTTNNTLLNAEVQKGSYDKLFALLSDQLKSSDEQQTVKEIAFCINAIHGLRLAKLFNCNVSVELHTDYADDAEETFQAGKRLFELCKQHFIIKVPFTAAGLIGARQLHEAGIPVNLTLGFSVRQNVIASLVAKPAYCNVFVGRISAYFRTNNLGGDMDIGEKVTAETQKCLRKVNERGYANTKLIAASIREPQQLIKLAGTDVLTIPLKVVEGAQADGAMPSGSGIVHNTHWVDENVARQFNLKHLWQASKQEKDVAMRLSNKVPISVSELVEQFHEYGCHDIFPDWNENELNHLKSDGKIPLHMKWAGKIENYQLGIDTLLNKAGLYAFVSDQQQLDNKIKGVLQ